MASAASPVWTLSQASAWVVFRDSALVDLFAPPKPSDWGAYMMYPDAKVTQIGERLEIFRALRDGRIAAFGRRPEPGTLREEIPAREWEDLFFDVLGPYRRLHNGTKDEPWRDILVRRADVERLWRRQSEVDGRSKHDRQKFRSLFLEQRARDPELSANAIIEKVSAAYEAETNRDAPALSTFKRYISGL